MQPNLGAAKVSASRRQNKINSNDIAVGINPEGEVISQAGVERSKTPAIVAILYMNHERVTEQICNRRFCRTFGTLYQRLRASHSTPCLCSVTPSGLRNGTYRTNWVNCYIIVQNNGHVLNLRRACTSKVGKVLVLF